MKGYCCGMPFGAPISARALHWDARRDILDQRLELPRARKEGNDKFGIQLAHGDREIIHGLAMQILSNSLRARYDSLTPRELMNAVVKGLANKQIASELGTAEIAVKIQRGRVMKKMDASSLPSLVRMALELEMEPGSKPLRMNQTKV